MSPTHFLHHNSRRKRIFLKLIMFSKISSHFHKNKKYIIIFNWQVISVKDYLYKRQNIKNILNKQTTGNLTTSSVQRCNKFVFRVCFVYIVNNLCKYYYSIIFLTLPQFSLNFASPIEIASDPVLSISR